MFNKTTIQEVYRFLKCCNHSCPKSIKLSVLAFSIHAIMHIIVGFILYFYSPNKYFFFIIATLDGISHYAGICGVVSFLFSYIKTKLKNLYK